MPARPIIVEELTRRARKAPEKRSAFEDVTSKGAVSAVLARLNLARGPVAHCCPLSLHEIERLELTVHVNPQVIDFA